MNHIRSIAFASLTLLLAGCLVSSESHTTRSGVEVSQTSFNQIESGKTTIGWVRATLGEPSNKTTAAQNDEVWKYTYTERTDSSGAIFLIFGGSHTDETTHNAFIEFKDGIVINKWRS